VAYLAGVSGRDGAVASAHFEAVRAQTENPDTTVAFNSLRSTRPVRSSGTGSRPVPGPTCEVMSSAQWWTGAPADVHTRR
jgi:hypothetical protein